MSAFFVQTGVIDDVIAATAPAFMSGDEMANQYGRELLTLNLDALKQRYDLPDAEIADYRAIIDGYTYHEPKTSEAQQLKSLNCWLYQCAEGNVPEQERYKRLDRHAEFLTEALYLRPKGRKKIIFGSGLRPFVEGYDDAHWDRCRA